MNLVTDLIRYLVDAMADAPWWAWPTSIVTVLGAVLLFVWWVGRCVRGALDGRRQRLEARATGDQDRLRSIRQARQQLTMDRLIAAQFVVAMTFSAYGMAEVAHLHAGIPVPANWLLFAVFEGFALVIMTMINQRAEKGLPSGALGVIYWVVMVLAAGFNTSHSDNAIGRAVWGSITLLAACSYALRMGAKRAGREEELRAAAGRAATRRLALVRWLHPVERVQVMVEMARDEELGADEATRRVRERADQRRRDRVNQAAARAVWRLQRYQSAGWVRRLFLDSVERRAQAALDAAGLAEDPAAMAAVLRRVQVLTFAERLAGLDYSTPADARRVTASLITAERLGERLELTSGERTLEERSTKGERKPDAAAVSGERERSAPEPRTLLSDADYERLLSARPGDERAPIEPAAAHRSERSTAHSSTAERRSLVAELLEENPDMTGPEIAVAVGARLGHPVSVATAKRDRAAVLKPE